jgi:DNA polymerase-3 subunit chi
MAEVWFYHIERGGVETVLPVLLRRGLDRGLRMAVETTGTERANQLSQQIWAAEDTAFIPHGLATDSGSHLQPIIIADSAENPNKATCRFYVDGAEPKSLDGLDRVCILFDGRDPSGLEAARALWRRFTTDNTKAIYQKQDESGRWQEQARSG